MNGPPESELCPDVPPIIEYKVACPGCHRSIYFLNASCTDPTYHEQMATFYREEFKKALRVISGYERFFVDNGIPYGVAHSLRQLRQKLEDGEIDNDNRNQR